MKPVRPQMTPERFAALAQSYGGYLARWPQADRAAAEGLVGEMPELTTILLQARRLDDLLFESIVAAPSADLVRRIVAQAPGRRKRPSGRRLAWLSGLAAVGVLASGAVAGAAVVAFSPPDHVDSLNGIYDQSGLGEIATVTAAQARLVQASGA